MIDAKLERSTQVQAGSTDLKLNPFVVCLEVNASGENAEKRLV